MISFVRLGDNSAKTIAMAFVNSIEYSILKTLLTLLAEVEARSEELEKETMFSRFNKAVRSFIQHVDAKMLPHDHMFYCDLFLAGYSLVSEKSSQDHSLLVDPPKLLE